MVVQDLPRPAPSGSPGVVTAGEGGAGVAVEQAFMEERTRQYKDVFKNLVYGWVVA